MSEIFLVFILLLSVSCGTERKVEVANDTGQGDSTPPTNPTGTPATGFSTILPILTTYCVPCHQASPYLKNEADFRASDAQKRALNLSMPPPGSAQARALSTSDRKTITSF